MRKSQVENIYKIILASLLYGQPDLTGFLHSRENIGKPFRGPIFLNALPSTYVFKIKIHVKSIKLKLRCLVSELLCL